MMTTKIYRGALLLIVFTMTACSSGPQLDMDEYSEPVFTAEQVLSDDYQDRQATVVYDPWEGMNQRVYNFNYHFDRYIFLPTVRGYQAVTPDFAEAGVSNFFDNLKDVNTFLNSVLQLEGKKSAESLGRVAVNTTIGLLGLFDVATHLGIDRPREDFGQTLGYWGVPNGPYLVLPFLGPSNVRDSAGLVPDFVYGDAVLNLGSPEIYVYGSLRLVDTRAQLLGADEILDAPTRA